MKFDYLTVENGLSNNRIRCILRDSKGFLWVGSEMGLNKYDGVNTIVFENIALDKKSLLGTDVLSIFEDSKKNLWIGTNNGLNLFDRKTETFTSFIHTAINSINEDNEHNIWATTNNGIYKLIKKGKKILHFSFTGAKKRENGSKFLVADVDKEGTLWLVDYSDAIWRFDPKNGSFKSFKDIRFKKTILEKCIKIDNYGLAWIGTKDNGLFSFNIKTHKFETYEINTNGTGVSGKSIYSLSLDDDDKHLLMAINQSGLNRLNVVTKKFEYYLYKEHTVDGLNNENLKCVYKDKEGITWVGTGAGGINVLNPKKNRFTVFRHNESSKNSIINNAIFKFFEDSKGLIWIGTDGGGLSQFDPKTKNFKNYQHNSIDNYSIGSNSVLGITEDKNHDIWVGCWAGGLNRFDRKSGRFYHYHPNSNDPTSISTNDVWDIITDDKGYLWLSYYEVGVDVFDTKKGVVKKYRPNSINAHSLPVTNIMGINRRIDNKLGFISGNGYCVYDDIKDSFQRNKILARLALFDVYFDKKGNYWVATKGNGLWVIWANGKIEKHDKSNGFPTNTICGILEDKHGNIWMSSYSGLSEYVIRTKTFHHYTLADGLQGNQFAPFARLKASDGTLYFGGYNGFNSFNPDSIKTNSYIPPVYIDEFQIFNKSVTPNTADSPLKQTIAETKKIILSYKKSVFSFGFNAINYTYPKKAIYAYKMVGYDNDWNYTDYDRRYATYTNLDPGNYTFMVKATNNDGVWNETPTTIKITITPPWWGTWWFKSILIFLILTLTITIYKIRIAGLERSKKELEIKVALRTDELKNTNSMLKEHATQLELANTELEINQKKILIQNLEIGKQKEILEKRDEENIQITKQLNEANQVKNRFFTNISHEFRTPLTLILGPLDSIITSPTVNKFLLEKLDVIKSNANRLLRLVNQLLELRNIDSEIIPLQLEEQDIIQFIKKVFSLFKLKAENKRINYDLIIQYDILIGYIDSDKLEKIIFNLLSNAFKFTPDEGTITVSVKVVASDSKTKSTLKELVLEVSDNGTGIDKDDLPHIFDRFFQSDSSLTRKREGSGIGLALSKELVEIYSGNISVKSESGIGSCFTVTIPIEFSDEILKEKNEIITEDSIRLSVTQSEIVAPLKKILKATTKILVVEDNKDLRRYLYTELENQFSVIETENGQIGIEKAKEFLPDIIISDIMMPVMDGFQFCEQVKTEWQTSHIPIILLTAKTDTTSIYHGLEIGADAYISKPFVMKFLIAQINNLIINRNKLFEKYSRTQTSTIGLLLNDNADKELMNKIMKIIDENLSNPLFGVDLLADKMNMSRSLLYKKVISITNLSIGEIMRNIRLEKSAQLLRENRYSVMEIALMIGFTDRPQFTRSFKSKYGEGPKQYQQKND